MLRTGENYEHNALPPVSISKPLPYNNELSHELLKKAKGALKKIHSFHLQAVYDTGSVRQVDRILVELLMAQLACVNQMMGDDLNTKSQGVIFHSGRV